MTDIADAQEDVADKHILNTPYQYPARYWQLDEKTQRSLDKVVEGRRPSGEYLPVPKDRPDEELLNLDAAVQVPPYTTINEIRKYVKEWRESGWVGANRPTRELLEYWSRGDASPRPFFCQVEAIETIVWLREAGKRSESRAMRRNWLRIDRLLKDVNEQWNEGIDRIAIKMATGTGKTRLMQMLICWIAVNKTRSVEFLAITPGLTVKERLEEIKPASGSVYDALLPMHLRNRIYQARVTVLNFQSFQKRDRLSVAGESDQLSGIGKKLIKRGRQEDPEHWKETDQAMLDRLLGRLGRDGIVVLNDEAHHCYAPSTDKSRDKDGNKEEKEYEEAAALWFNALRSLRKIERLGMVYDFSATPMYLRRPVELPAEVFPWTVSDYPLIEAIEAGLTKIPRVPVEDDSDMSTPMYRNVYRYVQPKSMEMCEMPSTISSLLDQMHEHYRTVDKNYIEAGEKRKPIMIVVANSIDNATALYGHIAGYHDGEKWVRGTYELFSNVEPDGSKPRKDPPTLLVHSRLDSPEELTGKIGAILNKEAEIHTPGVDKKVKRLERIRKIFNTVGQTGEPGERIRCIVSVSMLTEGWDARTVTHIFGFRRFGTQLLCEQVAGRGLRKTSFENAGPNGRLPAETVNIFGIPFNFMRAGDAVPPPPVEPYRVHSVLERAEVYRMTFPNIASYRIRVPGKVIRLDPSKVEEYIVEPKSIPTMTEITGMTGESHIFELTEKRRRYVLYKLASLLLEEFDADKIRRRGLFRSALASVQDWLNHPVVSCPDLRLLLVDPHVNAVPQMIARFCNASETGNPSIIPVFADEMDAAQPRALDTADIDFETTVRLFYDTAKSELNRAPCDSGSEVRVAEALDSIDDMSAWARNFRLGWQIPYFDKNSGIWKSYIPDFVARLKPKTKTAKPVHLVIEYKGRVGEDSDKKTKAIEDWWLPAVNGSNDPACEGEWRYVFIDSEENIHAQLWKEIGRK